MSTYHYLDGSFNELRASAPYESSNSVVSFSTSNVWEAGKLKRFGMNPLMKIYHYDGSLWSLSYDTTDGVLLSIKGINASDVWAGGSYASGNYWDAPPAMLHYQGSAWAASSLPVVGMGYGSIFGIMPLATNNVFACGLTDIWGSSLFYQWNGATWSTIDCSKTDLNAMALWAIDSNNVWLCGCDSFSEGVIVKYDGSHLTNVYTIFGSWLTAIHGSSANNIWAVGSGIIVHWDGLTWTSLPDPLGYGYYNGIWCFADNDVYIVGVNVYDDKYHFLHWDGLVLTDVYSTLATLLPQVNNMSGIVS